MIDSHAHLDMPEFDGDRREVIDRALAGGLTAVITIGIDAASSQKAVELARENGALFATAGCHPHEAGSCGPPELDQLARIAGEPKVVAWGEIGLDYFRNYAPREDQQAVFDRQLELAADFGLPVIIHARDSHPDVLPRLARRGRGPRQGVIHCFSGNLELALEYIALGYFISIPGTVTYPKAADVREVAAGIPLERLLIETDAPYLAPVPKRGRRNEPLYVTYTAAEIARLRHLKPEQVASRTAENTVFLFGLP